MIVYHTAKVHGKNEPSDPFTFDAKNVPIIQRSALHVPTLIQYFL